MNFYKFSKLSVFLYLVIICFSTTDLLAQKQQAEESASTSKPPSDVNPEFEKIKSRVSYVPGIKVIRGETHVIVPEQEVNCPAGSIFTFNNGDIQVLNRRSSDGGKTWKQVNNYFGTTTYQYPEPDGEVVSFHQGTDSFGKESYFPEKQEAFWWETDQKGIFEAVFFRSKDNGLNKVKDLATIILPESFSGWKGILCRKIVQINDGSLLMTIYIRNPKGGINEQLFRDIVIHSSDRGKTWNYLSTIAFDMAPSQLGEGFNEATLLALPDGKIHCYMRSGASCQASLGSDNNNDSDAKMPFGLGKQTPIYKSVSVDGGKHWSSPSPITTHGVFPDVVQLENGVIVMSYGRPGNWLTFNNNESINWGPVIPFYNDLYPPDCSNYISISEVAPNVLLAVYPRTNPNDHWQSELVGTYFKIKVMTE